MSVSPRLIDLLVCPEDKSALHCADEETLTRVNREIDAGTLMNRAGHKIEERISEGLVRADGRFLYPVRDDIPVMLIDEAIPL